MIITIDGPAASGKGTLARHIAAHLGYAHLDTGKLYRAVGLAVLSAGGDPADPAAATAAARALDPEALNPRALEDPALAGDRVARAASIVAATPEVRTALLDLQRTFAAQPPDGAAGAVLDGRDIGTVVCPGADVKFFVTASAQVRAERRHKELLARGEPSIYARVLADIQERDRRDSTRVVAPLRPAPDAKLIDTSALDAAAVLTTALAHLASRS